MTTPLRDNPSFRSYRDVDDIIRESDGGLKILYLGYARIYPNKEYFNLANKDWAEGHLIDKKELPAGGEIYQNIQPGVYLPTVNQESQFGWPDGLIREIKESYTISDPMLIFKKYDDCIKSIFIATSHPNPPSHFMSNLDLIENFISHFEYKAAKLIKKADNSRVTVSNDSGTPPSIHQNSNNTFLIEKSNTSAKKRYLKHNNKEISISAREYQVLFLLSHGYEIKKIAAELQISTRTVETYIYRIKSVFNLRTRTELSLFFWKNKLLPP